MKKFIIVVSVLISMNLYGYSGVKGEPGSSTLKVSGAKIVSKIITNPFEEGYDDKSLIKSTNPFDENYVEPQNKIDQQNNTIAINKPVRSGESSLLITPTADGKQSVYTYVGGKNGVEQKIVNQSVQKKPSLMDSFVDFFNAKKSKSSEYKEFEKSIALRNKKVAIEDLPIKVQKNQQATNSFIQSLGEQAYDFLHNIFSSSKKIDNMAKSVKDLQDYIDKVKDKKVVDFSQEAIYSKNQNNPFARLTSQQIEILKKPERAIVDKDVQAFSSRVAIMSQDLLTLLDMKKSLDGKIEENTSKKNKEISFKDTDLQKKYNENNKELDQVSGYVLQELVNLLVDAELAFGENSIEIKNIEENILSNVDGATKQKFVQLLGTMKTDKLSTVRPAAPVNPAPLYRPNVAQNSKSQNSTIVEVGQKPQVPSNKPSIVFQNI